MSSRLQMLKKEAMTLDEQRQSQREEFQLQLQAQRLEKEICLQIGAYVELNKFLVAGLFIRCTQYVLTQETRSRHLGPK